MASKKSHERSREPKKAPAKKVPAKKMRTKQSPAKTRTPSKVAPIAKQKRAATNSVATRPAWKSPARRRVLDFVVTRTLTFIATVKSKSATAVGLSVDNVVLDLAQDGETWSGQKSVDVGDTALIKFRPKGLDTTAWSVQVDIDCPNGPAKVLSQKGIIGTPGGAGFDLTVNIKPDPCA